MPDSERVLVLAPFGRDAELLATRLRGRRLEAEICPDVAGLCRRLQEGAGAVLIAEEALAGRGLACMVDALGSQPAWSDLPVILLTSSGRAALHDEQAGWVFRSSSNVTVLERPIRLATLFSMVESALKSRRRQYEVRRLLNESRRAIEERDRFLAMLGHELRNPLAAVVASVNILNRFAREDPSLMDEQCEVIARQSVHMARLVDDLLDVARITAGKIALKQELVDLRDLASSAMQSLRLATGTDRHQIQLSLGAEPVLVRCDPVRIEQVMLNLLNNAIKYTPENGRIDINVGREDGMAMLRVRDTGEGVPGEMLERIFEPFSQVSQPLERSRGGLGMGLAVVKGLVELHEGEVHAVSDGPGRGTEFVVRLPLTKERPEAQPVPKKGAHPQAHSCDILLVEDNADSRRVLARLLRLMGHRVSSAADGHDGLQQAMQAPPEVALLDIGLPGMDGYELCRRLRQAHGKRIYLVALTGYGQREDAERARAAGFDLHLVKPVDPQRLSMILSEIGCQDQAVA